MTSKTQLPAHIGIIHFIGIGGIGMSGIAEVLATHGYKIQGSDLKQSKIIERLQNIGIKVFLTQEAKNLRNVDVVVVSSAIGINNLELIEAQAKNIPVVSRAEMLAELMRMKSNVSVAGTHGKTTTTTMIAALLDSGGLDPTVINGGIINAYGSNARIGIGDWMVVEADESDGSFLKLPSTVSVVTNIDPEHLEYYGSFEALKEAFFRFLSNIPFYGLAVLCADDKDILGLIKKVNNRRIVTFGLNEGADLRAKNIVYKNNNTKFDIEFLDSSTDFKNLNFPMVGEHNILNVLAAVAVARHLRIEDSEIRKGLIEFKGVGRRFTNLGTFKNVTIIDDYAHHPTEINATLRAAKQSSNGRVLAIHQPHRFSRLSNLFDEFSKCFDDADIIGITPIFAAGENSIEGVTSDKLISRLSINYSNPVVKIEDEKSLLSFVITHAKPNDIVVLMGAGSISGWANNLVVDLK
jgi:UDP-N-acetylmuramate--alanine ligase